MAFGGGKEREVRGQRLSPAQGLAAERDLPEDDGKAERLFGVVVGGGRPATFRNEKRLGAREHDAGLVGHQRFRI